MKWVTSVTLDRDKALIEITDRVPGGRSRKQEVEIVRAARGDMLQVGPVGFGPRCHSIIVRKSPAQLIASHAGLRNLLAEAGIFIAPMSPQRWADHLNTIVFYR